MPNRMSLAKEAVPTTKAAIHPDLLKLFFLYPVITISEERPSPAISLPMNGRNIFGVLLAFSVSRRIQTRFSIVLILSIYLVNK